MNLEVLCGNVYRLTASPILKVHWARSKRIRADLVSFHFRPSSLKSICPEKENQESQFGLPCSFLDNADKHPASVDT